MLLRVREAEAVWEVGHPVGKRPDAEWKLRDTGIVRIGPVTLRFAVVITSLSKSVFLAWVATGRLGPVAPALVGLHAAADGLG